jgi:trimeric autotransporter adhesin
VTFGTNSTILANGLLNLNCRYAGTITKAGANYVFFNNANGNVTKFILKAGTANFSAGNRFGTGADRSDFLTFDGGTMRGDTSAWGSFGKSISLTANGGTISAYSTATSMTVDKPITSTGAGRLTINLAQLILSNTGNSWSGPMTINGSGTKVTLSAANVIPDTCIVSVTGTLNLANFSETISALAGTGAVTLGSGTLTLASGSQTFSGVISGTGGLVENGFYETLSGANTYGGPTTINVGALVFSGASTCTGITTVNSGGTLRIATSGTAFPDSPINLASSGSTLDVNNLSVTIAALSGTGVVSNNASQTLTVNGNLTTGGGTGVGMFNYSCYSGALTNGNLVKDGTHAMALRGSNTFDGTFSFGVSGSAGTLSVGAGPNRLPPTTGLSVPGGARFQLDANSQTVSTLGGSGSINLGGGILTDNEGAGNTFSGVIQNSELAGSSTALGHGLRGYYYDNIDMTNLKAVRDDATVNFADLTVTNNITALPNAGIANTTFSIRWLGQVLSTAAGTYQFTTACDDGSRLWVNGQLLVDNWVSQGVIPKSGTITLAANTRYAIVMEYFQGTGGAGATLSWMPPGDLTTNVIPTDYLFLPGPGALVKSGAGTTLILANANTYSGDTIVAAGTLIAQADGALGNGNVTVNNANLTLQNGATNGYMNPAASLSLIGNAVSPMVALNFSGMEDIRSLSLDGVAQPAGTYGSSGSTATHQDNVHFDVNYAGILNVVGAPSTTVLTSSGSPVAYGTLVTLTATLAPSSATGTVTFYDGANWLGTAPLNGSGIATFSVTNLQVTASPHTLTAVYSGDATYDPSTSAGISQTTTQAPLTVTAAIVTKVYDGTTAATIASLGGMLASDTNYVHAAAGYTATFIDKNVGNGKQVSISGLVLAGSLADNYTLSDPAFNTTGNITPKALTVTGITANNKVYDATTAATINVGAATLQAAEAVGTGTTADGKPYTVDTVTLNTGSVTGTFADANVANGKTVTINGLALGGGDAGNYSVTSPTTTANITKANSQEVLTSSSNPSSPGADVTFTATLSPNPPSAGIPTGTVTFVTNNVALGAVTLTGGVAATNTAALPVGSTTVEARYTGDANFIGVTNSLTQVVNSAICSSTNRILSVTQNGGNSLTLNLIGTYQAQYYIVSQTNVAQPLANWTLVPGTTNTVADPGGLWSVTVTNPAPAFYRAQAMSPCP